MPEHNPDMTPKENILAERLRQADPAESLTLRHIPNFRPVTVSKPKPILRLSLAVLTVATLGFAASTVSVSPVTEFALFESAAAASRNPETAVPNLSLNGVNVSGLSTRGGQDHIYSVSPIAKVALAIAPLKKYFDVTGVAKETKSHLVAQSAKLSSTPLGRWVSIDLVSGAWNYSNENTGSVCHPVTASYSVCKNAKRVAPIPNETKAIETLKGLMSDMGVSAKDFRFTTSLHWGFNVQGQRFVHGHATPIIWTLTWGSSGAISNATGHLVYLTDHGRFKTVSQLTAAKRWDDFKWWGMPTYSEGLLLGSHTNIRWKRPNAVERVASVYLSVASKSGVRWLVPGFHFKLNNGATNSRYVISTVPGVIKLS